VELKLGRGQILFPPILIKEFGKYLANTDQNNDKKGNNPLQLTIPSMMIDKSNKKVFIKELTCKESKDITLHLTIKSKGLSLICLHHLYETPFIKFALDESIVYYQQLVDHSKMSVTFGSFEVIDMTQYPTTTIPKDFPLRKMNYNELEANYSCNRLAILKAPNNIEMIVYGIACSLSDSDKVYSFTSLKLNEVWLMYQNEMLADRVTNYVLEQFFWALKPFDMEVVEDNKQNIVQFDSPESYAKFKVCLKRD